MIASDSGLFTVGIGSAPNTYFMQRAAELLKFASSTIDGTYDDAVRVSSQWAAEDVLVVSDTSWEGYTEVPRTVIDGYEVVSLQSISETKE